MEQKGSGTHRRSERTLRHQDFLAFPDLELGAEFLARGDIHALLFPKRMRDEQPRRLDKSLQKGVSGENTEGKIKKPPLQAAWPEDGVNSKKL